MKRWVRGARICEVLDWIRHRYDLRIHADKLRAEWLSESPAPQADFLLHVAWTAEHASEIDSLRCSP